jgi:site-specific DNA recombinase
VIDGLRQQMASSQAEPKMTDRGLIERHVERVTIKPREVEISFIPRSGVAAASSSEMARAAGTPIKIILPWAAPSFPAPKGIVHAPSASASMKPETRDALLTAIAKARSWIDGLRLDHLGSFSEIARREGQCERHIRSLARLAFLSPRIIAAIAGGTAPAHLTVTGLARALPYSWTEQERDIGLVRHDPANA